MIKKIAVINDISGFGKCSLTAAIPIISALKVQACPMPTSVLSNQTCYSSFYIKELTEEMRFIADKWLELGFEFDGIYSGFLSAEKQADEVINVVDNFKKPNTIFILDPVMGDENAPYENYTSGLRDKMLYLSEKADIILPNVTELCLLSGLSPLSFTNNDKTDRIDEIKKAAESFSAKTGADIIVTGINTAEGDKKFINNLIVSKTGISIVKKEKLKGGYSGTGDIMSSIVSAMAVRKFSVEKAVETAANFIYTAVEDTAKYDINVNDGVNFEKFLGYLTDI